MKRARPSLFYLHLKPAVPGEPPRGGSPNATDMSLLLNVHLCYLTLMPRSPPLGNNPVIK
jgi:hypothetical protein